MSQIDYKLSLQRLANSMLQTGYTLTDIVTMVIEVDHSIKALTTKPEPKLVGVLHVQLENGLTKQYPDTPEMRAQLAREKRAKEVKEQPETAEDSENIDELIAQAQQDLELLTKMKENHGAE